MLLAEPADPGTNIEEVNTMIKKWIENTEEIRQRLTQMLMDDASEMCRYQRDIYMYIDEDGLARLEWFVNVGGNNWIDDDHILLYRCREHYDEVDFSDCCCYASDNCMDTVRARYEQSIEDAASDYADQADEIMRGENQMALEHGYIIEDHTGRTAVVWLFVIDAEDQRALDKQRGGDSNG